MDKLIQFKIYIQGNNEITRWARDWHSLLSLFSTSFLEAVVKIEIVED